MNHFRRFVLALATTAVLAAPTLAKQVCYFGECGEVANTPAKAQSTAAAKKIGVWEVGSVDGKRYVAQRFDDGAVFMMAKVDGGFVLLFTNPDWKLTEGQQFPVKADIDGKVFEGNAKALDRTSVAVRVDATFMKAIYRGEGAVITVVKDRWNLDLTDAAKALEAVGGIETASR
jgi:hypothetical protein